MRGSKPGLKCVPHMSDRMLKTQHVRLTFPTIEALFPLKGNALKLLTRWPATRNLAHRGIHHVQKWRGISPDSLPPQRLIMRLLILKIWGDVFMNYPAAPISENSRPELVRGPQPAHTPSPSPGSKL